MATTKLSRIGVIALGVASAMSAAACNKEGGGKSPAAAWVDSPTPGSKAENKIQFSQLGVSFEIPDTLYVFKNCGEASHSPEGSQKWVPVITCRSGAADIDPADALEEDGSWEDDTYDEFDESQAEPIDLTFYVTHKSRPLDERAVTWFESQYKQAGLDVSEISYQGDYNKKKGIYAKLHVMDDDTGAPKREIVQFMFPENGVVFIAKMEYPYGESRSVDQDWQYILWNFDLNVAAGG